MSRRVLVAVADEQDRARDAGGDEPVDALLERRGRAFAVGVGLAGAEAARSAVARQARSAAAAKPAELQRAGSEQSFRVLRSVRRDAVAAARPLRPLQCGGCAL